MRFLHKTRLFVFSFYFHRIISLHAENWDNTKQTKRRLKKKTTSVISLLRKDVCRYFIVYHSSLFSMCKYDLLCRPDPKSLKQPMVVWWYQFYKRGSWGGTRLRWNHWQVVELVFIIRTDVPLQWDGLPPHPVGSSHLQSEFITIRVYKMLTKV